jgi:hypothetical protein
MLWQYLAMSKAASRCALKQQRHRAPSGDGIGISRQTNSGDMAQRFAYLCRTNNARSLRCGMASRGFCAIRQHA